MLFKLVVASIWSRRTMAYLTCTSIAISILVLIGVEHLRTQVKDNFERTISGVDLIVGSRTSQINLLLYSVFKMGNPSNNLSWQRYADISADKQVKWSVPISLGDSHQGFSVTGTTAAYFEHVKYANKQALSFNQGRAFTSVYEVVLGADVAAQLGYVMGQQLVLSHGAGKVSFTHHDDHPFKVVGILQGTGTPTDQTLYIPLQSVQIIHQPGAHKHTHEEGVQQQQLLSTLPLNVQSAPQISAFLLGVKSKLAILTLQRNINQSTPEALSAIMPVLALRQLWQIVSGVELILKVISWLVLCTALIGMCTMLLASMQERQRELAVLRALGAKAGIIIGLLLFEALLLALVGALIGYAGITLLLMLAQPILQSEFALYISPFVDIRDAAQYILYAVLAAILLAFIPAYRAYRQSLLTGLSQH